MDHSWAASARALAAYDVSDETRIYAAAGIAFTEAAAAYAPSTRRADEEPLTGWTLALGLEHDYSDRLFSRAELRYTSYEDGAFGHLTPSITESEETAVMIGLAWRFRR